MRPPFAFGDLVESVAAPDSSGGFAQYADLQRRSLRAGRTRVR